MHIHVQRSKSLSNQRVETTQVSNTDEWLNKMWHLYDRILFSLKKEFGYMLQQWMNLENIILSERSWTQKDKYCMISLMRDA